MYVTPSLILAVSAAYILVHAETDTNIYFPDEYEDKMYKISSSPLGISNTNNLADKNLYEQYINRVISRGIANLSLAINKAYQDTKFANNIVFAPLNIAGALALILLGSNGNTFQELAEVLGLATGIDIENNSERVHEELGRMILKIESTAGLVMGQQITLASAIFVQNNFPIRKLYKETAENLYRNEVLNVDFKSNPLKALQLVNAWVSDRTFGKITDILTEAPSPSTKVVVASAMYFKAKWEHPFLEGQTARRPFFPNGRKTVTDIKVDMMANIGYFPYFKDVTLGCEILGFPYQGNGSVMYIIMPFNSNAKKLKEFEEKLTTSDLEYLTEKTVPTNALILLPKMRIESTIDLKSVLSKLGVKSLFNPYEANLGLLSPGGNLTQIRHIDLVLNPIAPISGNPDEVLIFNRMGSTINCTNIFNSNNNTTMCEDTVNMRRSKQANIRPNKRVAFAQIDTIDSIRNLINNQNSDNNQNPGLSVDKVIHKVFMDITETGTEAAAATAVTLFKSLNAISFRVDVPFIFFIRHEETKTIMFWGSVEKPTPNFNNS
ncbi:serine protease inhibitor 28Dc-like [Diorhabda sublineata]|uniref:serine protease inhibitor 28Dc-like n=1 Tax=Diorhabda sublineata TaxID=1163346 RepID=UPI0024E15AD5|nr:serine protease inhibitor 28Dc-like [Diorhabda sublineata]